LKRIGKNNGGGLQDRRTGKNGWSMRRGSKEKKEILFERAHIITIIIII